MRPISFDGCFGWLHADIDAPPGEIGVVLCSGLKNDGLTGHRSFRQLADTLAGAGYPTVRFDYPGTGDSRDIEAGEDGAEYWSAWRQSIQGAADWLRTHGGARRIVLCGLRFGATLATAVAAERGDVAALVLLAPVLRGRSYIRQLTIEARLGQAANQPAAGLLVHELHFSSRAFSLISEVDLRRVVPAPGCRVAVYAEAPSPVLSECVAAWSSGGAAVTCLDFTGLEPMLRPSFMSHEGPAEVARITDWLRASLPAEPRPAQRLAQIIYRAPGLSPPGCVETPLLFGPTGSLFGMLCRPSGGREDDQVVVIVNGGGDPHHGFARGAVDLARRLAAEGIASLRMDFAGLGDSVAPGDAPVHVFETDRRPDIAAAIDMLAERGYRRFAVQGVCSGAYHAFHAALDDARIGMLLLVNLPMFQWQPGLAVEFLNHVVPGPGYLLRRLGRKDLWSALLQGKLGACRRLWFAVIATPVGRRLSELVGSQARRFACDGMRRLSSRTRTLFLAAESDASVAMLSDAFGPGRVPVGAELLVLSDLDHSLSNSDMQRKAGEQMIAFLKRSPMLRDRSPRSAREREARATGRQWLPGTRLKKESASF